MKNRIALALTTLAITVVLAPTTALAQEAPAALVTVSEAGGITWVDASLPAGDNSKVEIKILKLRKGADRMWQRCDFRFSGAGDYRCGFDSSSGSLAASQAGNWVAKVFVDGARISRLTFSL